LEQGIPTRFFQRNWLILKQEIIAVVKVSFANGVDDTIIAFIPKVNNAFDLKRLPSNLPL
jgi:hypothetical protein